MFTTSRCFCYLSSSPSQLSGLMMMIVDSIFRSIVIRTRGRDWHDLLTWSHVYYYVSLYLSVFFSVVGCCCLPSMLRASIGSRNNSTPVSDYRGAARSSIMIMKPYCIIIMELCVYSVIEDGDDDGCSCVLQMEQCTGTCDRA